MLIDPMTLPRRERGRLLNGIVGPRPIAWVSTLAPDGARNLAPFSFFNVFSHEPPIVALAPQSRRGAAKDTLTNVLATRELVINVVSRELAERANASSAEFGPEVDEWEVAGVRSAPSDLVAPPRVAEAPAALECELRKVVDLGSGDELGATLLIATVVRVHIVADGFRDGLVDSDALDLVGRMGGDEWCLSRERIALPRPASVEPNEVRAEARGREEAP